MSAPNNPHKTRGKRDNLIKLLDDAQELSLAVGQALHVDRDLAAAEAALHTMNANLANARALHATNPIQPTATDTRDSGAELDDLSRQAAAAQDAVAAAFDAAQAAVDLAAGIQSHHRALWRVAWSA